MSNRDTCERAWGHLAAGRLDEARALFVEVLARDANYARALHGMGRIFQTTGNPREAASLLARASRSAPREPEIQFDLALAHYQSGRKDEALRGMRKAIAASPNVSRYHAALGTLLDERGDCARAAVELRAALELDPADAPARVNLASVLFKLDDFPSAESQARQALELNPDLPLARISLAQALEARGDKDGALTEIRAAVALAPDDPDAHFYLSQLLLMSGQYAEGFREYEWRFKTRIDPAPAAGFSTPAWDGSDLHGKTLLVHTEQGLGDSIQFARYLPLAAKRGARIVLRCQPPLGALLRTVGGVEIVTTGEQALPSFDAHVPLLGLPNALSASEVPREVPYLYADGREIAAWESRLAAIPRPRIGLCWAGNREHPRDRHRSMDPKHLAPLNALAGMQWISLQKNWRGEKPPLAMHDFTEELHDFADTAALVMNLDLVITVDTSVCHLAGALGKRVWTLEYFLADWRFPRGRSDSAWYPTMRVFHQPALLDWQSVIADVAGQARRATQASRSLW
jgi:tetratricopeptide (TPR) repeat protein